MAWPPRTLATSGKRPSTTELFQAADRAQYVAKRQGARYAIAADEQAGFLSA